MVRQVKRRTDIPGRAAGAWKANKIRNNSKIKYKQIDNNEIKELEPVTIDTIKMLRKYGYKNQARAQLTAFRKSVVAEKNQIAEEIAIRDRLIKQVLKERELIHESG